MLKIITLFYLGFFYGIINSHRIILNNFDLSDCHTKCKNGLLLLIDTCKVTSTIVFEQALPYQAMVYFENLENELPIIFSLNIPSECKGFRENTEHYCTHVNETAYEVIIIVKAQQTFNKAKLRGYLTIGNGSRIYSDTQTLPEVYEFTEAEGILKVNGEIMDTDFCNATVQTNILNLEFLCVSRAKPCVIQITVGDIMVQNLSEDRVLKTYDFKDESEKTLVIKYSPCSLDWQYNIIKCSFQRALNTTFTEHAYTDSNTAGIVVSVVIFSVVCAVVILVLILRRRMLKRKNSCRLAEKNAETADDEGNDISSLKATQSHEDFSVLSELVKTTSLVNSNIKCPLEEKTSETVDDEGNENTSLKATKTYEEINVLDDLMKTTSSVNSVTDIPESSVAGHHGNKYDSFTGVERTTNALHTSNDSGHTYEKQLMNAIRRNDYREAVKLIRNNYVEDVNQSYEKSGLSFLMCASKNGANEITSLLIEFGSKVDAVDKKGNTALIYASKKGFVKIAEDLISHGANVNACNNIGRAPLIYASHNGWAEIVDVLIKNKAEVNTTDKEGKTALKYAYTEKHAKIANLLYEKGADISVLTQRRKKRKTKRVTN